MNKLQNKKIIVGSEYFDWNDGRKKGLRQSMCTAQTVKEELNGPNSVSPFTFWMIRDISYFVRTLKTKTNLPLTGEKNTLADIFIVTCIYKATRGATDPGQPDSLATVRKGSGRLWLLRAFNVGASWGISDLRRIVNFSLPNFFWACENERRMFIELIGSSRSVASVTSNPWWSH